MTFAEKIKEAREATGLSVRALAERTLISKRTLEKWESGERTPPPYVQRFVLNELEGLKAPERSNKKIEAEEIYLIYKDSADDYCNIAGYIKGTEKEAKKYCDEYNEKQSKYWCKVEYDIIHDLLNK